MVTGSRHQCLIYKGSPARHLASLAAVTREKLAKNHRCLYLDSPPMVAGMRSYLAAAGVDVVDELAKASLVLSSDRGHLDGAGRFDAEGMLYQLADAVKRAKNDGFRGLWAMGDMTWEMGSRGSFGQLLAYEWKLEEFIREHDGLSGICVYHSDTLPREALQAGLLTHESLFINETLSRLNPHYVRGEALNETAGSNPHLDKFVNELCQDDAAKDRGQAGHAD